MDLKEIRCDDMEKMYLALARDQLWAVRKTVMEL
jgi:hypothetical protein